eukprot:6619162-Prymnesium_polylepis.1
MCTTKLLPSVSHVPAILARSGRRRAYARPSRRQRMSLYHRRSTGSAFSRASIAKFTCPQREMQALRHSGCKCRRGAVRLAAG